MITHVNGPGNGTSFGRHSLTAAGLGCGSQVIHLRIMQVGVKIDSKLIYSSSYQQLVEIRNKYGVKLLTSNLMSVHPDYLEVLRNVDLHVVISTARASEHCLRSMGSWEGAPRHIAIRTIFLCS